MTTSPDRAPFAIRPAKPADKTFILTVYDRVEETGAPAWRRDHESHYSKDWIDRNLNGEHDDQIVLIAEDADGTLLGYTWVLRLQDFDEKLPHGHISHLGVAPEAEGRGVGAQLIAAAESWCRDQGLTEVTLHCYVGNERAQRLYWRLGFENEWYKMRKALD